MTQPAPLTDEQPIRAWTDIDPKDAVSLNLAERLDITAPLNENGERCPWPWEPQQLVGAPMGQYRCGYCMAMVMAGMPHLDYSPEERTLTRENTAEVAEWCGGRRAGGANELVAFDQFGETVYARPGDTIHRDGFGEFTIRTASSASARPVPAPEAPDGPGSAQTAAGGRTEGATGTGGGER